jgi:hypothetical protein
MRANHDISLAFGEIHTETTTVFSRTEKGHAQIEPLQRRAV